MVIDNLAPYGDATLALPGGVAVGSVSSITSAFIAQLLTIGVVERMNGDGRVASALPVGQHPWRGRAQPCVEKKYEGRIRRHLTADPSQHSLPHRTNREQSEGTSDGHLRQAAWATRFPPRLTGRGSFGRHRVAHGLRHLGHGHQHPDELRPRGR